MPNWRRNLLALRQHFNAARNSTPHLKSTGEVGMETVWHQALSVACAPLAHRVVGALRDRLAQLDPTERTDVRKSPDTAAQWKSFFDLVGNAALAELMPADCASREEWTESCKQPWARDMQRKVLHAIPVEARIMLGELVDEYRNSVHYKNIVQQPGKDIGKRTMDRKIFDVFITVGLDNAIHKPLRSNMQGSPHGASSTTGSRSAQGASSAYGSRSSPAKPARRASVQENVPALELDKEMRQVFDNFLYFCVIGLSTATAQDREDMAVRAKLHNEKQALASAANFAAILVSDARRRARGRSCKGETVGGKNEQHKTMLKAALESVLAELNRHLPDQLARSDSETSDGTVHEPMLRARWRGQSYPQLHPDFIECFDAIRLELLTKGDLKTELRSPQELIDYVLPRHEGGQALTPAERRLLYSISYLAGGKIEAFVSAMYFNNDLPLKTHDLRTVIPAPGTLHIVLRLEWQEQKLLLRYTLLSPDVSHVTLLPEHSADILTSESRKTESAAPFKLCGYIGFDDNGHPEFKRPRLSAMNFNILLDEPASDTPPSRQGSEKSASVGRSHERSRRLVHKLRSPFRISSSTSTLITSIDEAATPTKLRNKPDSWPISSDSTS